MNLLPRIPFFHFIHTFRPVYIIFIRITLIIKIFFCKFAPITLKHGNYGHINGKCMGKGSAPLSE